MRWFSSIAAAAALVAAGGACGSQITVPDQGVIVTGCQQPSFCFRADCDCTRASVEQTMLPSACKVAPPDCSSLTDLGVCGCPAMADVGNGQMVTTQCLEPAQACVGRGVLCAVDGRCLPSGGSCASSDRFEPPMLVTKTLPDGGAPFVESRCQYVDDVCCPGSDAGISISD